MKKQFFSEKEVAKMGIKSMQALRNDRWLGRGLPYYKVGKAVRYSIADLKRYLQKGRIEPKN